MMRFKSYAAMGLVVGAVACGGATKEVKAPTHPSGKTDRSGHKVSKAAARSFNTALDAFTSHDKASDWNEGVCKDVASQFVHASDQQKKETNRALPEAIYNAGLVYQRCDDDADAKKEFQKALDIDQKFYRAQAQLVLYDYQNSHDLDGTIGKLSQIIRAAHFQLVGGLVSLAALQMQRGNDTPDSDGKNDLERAKLNLQRALAIDDSYMPAFNQLAIYYMELAKAKAQKKGAEHTRRRSLQVAGAKGAEVNSQQLDLAALVASQAIKKDPTYAPIYNTAGLIQVQLKDFNGAVKNFKRARQLDPKFFEADMNYGAVNLGFRGFKEAESAYRDALKLHPKEYAAHLGLALALRGEIDDANWDKNVAEAQKELDTARKLAPGRAETYYNEAILTQEYKAKSGKGDAIPMLEKAADLYGKFVAKAGTAPEFAEAVKRSKEREQDIRDTVKFIKEGQQAKAEQDKLNKQQAGKKKAGGAAAPATPAPKKGAAPKK